MYTCTALVISHASPSSSETACADSSGGRGGGDAGTAATGARAAGTAPLASACSCAGSALGGDGHAADPSAWAESPRKRPRPAPGGADAGDRALPTTTAQRLRAEWELARARGAAAAAATAATAVAAAHRPHAHDAHDAAVLAQLSSHPLVRALGPAGLPAAQRLLALHARAQALGAAAALDSDLRPEFARAAGELQAFTLAARQLLAANGGAAAAAAAATAASVPPSSGGVPSAAQADSSGSAPGACRKRARSAGAKATSGAPCGAPSAPGAPGLDANRPAAAKARARGMPAASPHSDSSASTDGNVGGYAHRCRA